MSYNITVVGCVIRERAAPLITLITQKNMNDGVIVHLGNVGVILSFYCYGRYVFYGHAEIMKRALFRVKRGFLGDVRNIGTPRLSSWMLENIPEGLAFQDFPEPIRKEALLFQYDGKYRRLVTSFF